jgi:hypothetical protein
MKRTLHVTLITIGIFQVEDSFEPNTTFAFIHCYTKITCDLWVGLSIESLTGIRADWFISR